MFTNFRAVLEVKLTLSGLGKCHIKACWHENVASHVLAIEDTKALTINLAWPYAYRHDNTTFEVYHAFIHIYITSLNTCTCYSELHIHRLCSKQQLNVIYTIHTCMLQRV